MITYDNIVSKFSEFVENHFFLKTFTHGSPSDVDLDKFEVYPLLHLVYTGGSYENNTKTYDLEIYILDNPPAKDDKTGFQKSAITASEQAAEDILADIETGGNIFQFGYHYDVTSANITPLEETQSNTLAGTLLTIQIQVAYTYDSCNAPLAGVPAEGSSTPPYSARGLLRVRENDGSPDVLSVATINVPNGSLTDDGNGEISLAFGTAGDSSRVIVTAKNVSGGTLAKGTPVHAITPVSAGQQVEVIAARADTPSAMPATLVLNETLEDEAEGEAIVVGLIQNVDTSAFTAGDIIYVGSTGGYTNTKPTGTDLIQNLGVVVKSHASSGSGIVYGSGRSNDVPNIPDGQTWIGNASGVATPTTLADVATTGTAISLTDIDSVGSGNIITDAERTKLTGIEDGAEVNVNADWNATTGDAEIFNKPTLVENIGDLGDVTETSLAAGQLLYYDGAGWINKTVVGGSAVAYVEWTGQTTTEDIGTYPSAYQVVDYPSTATISPAGPFSILYNATLNSLQVTGLSTGTSIAFTAKFGVTPAVVNDVIDLRMRAFFSASPIFSDINQPVQQTVFGLPVDVETEVVVSGNLVVGSHASVGIFLETAGLYSAGVARCIDFEITFT